MAITRREQRDILNYLSDKKRDYQKHQRDYSLLGTTAVARGLFHENKKFFGVAPSPIFMVIKDGILFHVMARQDGINRCKSWLRLRGLKKLKAIEKRYSAELDTFHRFSKQQHRDPEHALVKLYQYFVDFTNIIFLGYEIPEYVGNELSKDIRNQFFSIRREYEEVHRKCFELEKKLIAKMEKKYGVQRGQLLLLTIKEFERFLKQHVLPDNLEKRNQFFVVRYDTNGERQYHNKELWKYFNGESGGNSKVITGNPAFPGVVTGTVRIIKKVAESSDLQKGEILVTAMTDPRYLSAMKKSSAIITDEGGITCHAAIVARELKKPCVIGTKVATAVLKDGDTVRMDASRGIVTLLHRK